MVEPKTSMTGYSGCQSDPLQEFYDALEAPLSLPEKEENPLAVIDECLMSGLTSEPGRECPKKMGCENLLNGKVTREDIFRKFFSSSGYDGRIEKGKDGAYEHRFDLDHNGFIDFSEYLKADVSTIVLGLTEFQKKEMADHYKKIVSDLLDFSRSSSGQDNKDVEINALIEKIVPFIKAEIKSYNVNLKLELGSGLPYVHGNANKLQQVFLNLLTNACQSMNKGGDLAVKTFEENGHVCVSVEDSGCGIPKEHLTRIFDPFFTTKPPGKGTGLGLSVSYRIIKEHDGIIDVESAEGAGTKFIVRMPAV